MPFVTVNGVGHPVSGAQVAILDGARVYIQFRPFPPGWELPGGHVMPGEDPAVTAVREVREETGLDVRIVGIAGVYRWGGLRTAADALYVAHAVGDNASRRTVEAWSHRWVSADRLPRTLFPWIHERIADAFGYTVGAVPAVRVQHIGPVHVALFGMGWLRVPVEAAISRLGRTRDGAPRGRQSSTRRRR